MGMKLRDKLKQAGRLQTKKVKLAQGDDITVTELSAQDRMVVLDYLQAIVELQEKGEAKSQHYATLTLTIVCAGLRDEETGELAFKVSEPQDRAELMQLGDGTIRKLHEAICEISGLDYLINNQKK